MEVPILEEVVVIFALSIAVLLACHRLKLPAVVGFLVTGVLCGPHGLKLVSAIDDVQMLASVGIVLLLFTVGMEFSIQKIIKYKYYFFGGGLLQVLGTLALCLFIGLGIYRTSWEEAIFLGFLISLSSTAIVLRALDDKGEADSPQGRLILGILIFQDIVAVPMMLLIPMLASHDKGLELSELYGFLKGLGALLAVLLIAFKGVPKLLYYVTKTRNREFFLLTVLTICFAIAWATSFVGLSVSLGAFLAGLIVAESDYSDEAVGMVLPFQEIFTSFFFVSMGMLLNIRFVLEQPWYILAITAAVLVLKLTVAGASALVLGMPLRAAILVGMALSQVGEFSFVLAHSGMEYHLMSEYNYQLFLAVSLLTMSLTPSLMALSQHVVTLAARLPLPQKLKTGLNYLSEEPDPYQKSDHIIITGFGVRGRHLARAAKQTGLSYVVLEMNTETVKQERKKGEPIYYGDACNRAVLLHAGIKFAKVMVVVINDAVAALRMVKVAKQLNPNIYIVTRTRYFQEVPLMFQLGANEVIPDEFGSSLEIFARVLEKYTISPEVIHNFAHGLRLEGYEKLRWQSRAAAEIFPRETIDFKTARIETICIAKASPFAGKTIAESELKKVHGLTVLLIKRQEQTLATIEAETRIEAADALVVIGTPENLQKAKATFC